MSFWGRVEKLGWENWCDWYYNHGQSQAKPSLAHEVSLIEQDFMSEFPFAREWKVSLDQTAPRPALAYLLISLFWGGESNNVPLDTIGHMYLPTQIKVHRYGCKALMRRISPWMSGVLLWQIAEKGEVYHNFSRARRLFESIPCHDRGPAKVASIVGCHPDCLDIYTLGLLDYTKREAVRESLYAKAEGIKKEFTQMHPSIITRDDFLWDMRSFHHRYPEKKLEEIVAILQQPAIGDNEFKEWIRPYQVRLGVDWIVNAFRTCYPSSS